MKHDNHDLRVSARTCRLTAGTNDTASDGPPYRFGGIAVAAGDVLRMDDGTRVLMTEEELRAAAETQAGEPLTKDHPEDDSGRPKYPPDVDETAGKVPKAGWVDDQQAVAYEAMTHDEAVATGVQAGSYDVSVHPFFETQPYDGPEADVVATNIQFGDLSVVSKGDSPSATAEFGPNEALASWTAEADIGAELTAATDDAGGQPGGREGLIASTVSGTLRALGFDQSDVDGHLTASDSDEEAESSTGSADSPDMNRDNIIKTLSDEHDFDEEWLEDADDDHLEHLQESLVEETDTSGSSTDNPGNGDPGDTNQDGDGETTLADMTVDDLADGLQERGFVTEDNATDLVQEAEAQASKRQKAEEIVARSDEYSEDDVEDLVASADALVDREFERVRGETSAQLPGNSGQLTAAAPSTGDEEDWKDYNTGLADQDGGED